jgi:hypothetical protein
MKVIRCARLDLPVDLPALQSEVAALPDRWQRHFQTAHYQGDWTVLPLRSLGGVPDEALPFALGTAAADYASTPLLAHCPSVERFLDSLQCPVRSARLLNLKRGSVIKPHRDAELAFENGEARLHVPVFTNPDVEFVIHGQRVIMDPGSCWYINANLTHEVANRGTTDRVHLVIDCGVNDWLQECFNRAEVSYETLRRDPVQLRQMIEAFRAMNTPASLALIPELEAELSHVR